MSNYIKNLLNTYKLVKETAKKENKPITEVFRDLSTIYEDKLSLTISEEYSKTGTAKLVYEKYGISEKYFKKLLRKVQKVEVRPHRKVKEFIYSVTKGYNITHQEYVKISQYFDKRELDADKTLEKLKSLRAKK